MDMYIRIFLIAILFVALVVSTYKSGMLKSALRYVMYPTVRQKSRDYTQAVSVLKRKGMNLNHWLAVVREVESGHRVVVQVYQNSKNFRLLPLTASELVTYWPSVRSRGMARPIDISEARDLVKTGRCLDADTFEAFLNLYDSMVYVY